MPDIANVKNGKLEENEAITTTSKKTTGTTELGKDAFLQLLVTQMKNQDPLNPSNDTEFVAQLATFSQLEQLQNITAASEKSQAFSLVGKEVIVQNEDSNGKKTEVTGTVDFVTMSGNKTFLNINGNSYDMEKLVRVIDDNYILKTDSPSIPASYALEYNADVPKSVSFQVNMGKNKYLAKDLAVALNDKIIDPKLVHLVDDKVTIDAAAFENLENGKYALSVVFDNAPLTTISDKVSISVTNSKVNNSIVEV